MKVSEAIDRLKVGDTVWLKGTFDLRLIDTEEIRLEFSDACSGLWLNGEQEISLTEPQAEKVEVTEEQAQLLKEREGETIFTQLSVCKSEEEELFARAILFGYTVKQEPKWVVKKGKDCVLTSFTFFDEKSVNYESNSYGKNYMYFTDRTKAEAVATLVEGSVEEA